MNPIQQAAAAAHQAVARVAGVRVRYRRGDTYTDADPPAVPARSTFESQDRDGLITQAHVRDYLLLADDLTIDGVVIEPEDGDLIEETIGETTHEFMVLGPGGQAAAWIYRDPSRSQLRVHTKLVDSREAK